MSSFLFWWATSLHVTTRNKVQTNVVPSLIAAQPTIVDHFQR